MPITKGGSYSSDLKLYLCEILNIAQNEKDEYMCAHTFCTKLQMGIQRSKKELISFGLVTIAALIITFCHNLPKQ
jgi:hypothetical protein